MKQLLLFLLILVSPLSGKAAITTYSLDKEQVCSSISHSPYLSNFLSLREFFRVNPAFASETNLSDQNYCLKLQLSYGLFNKSDNSPDIISQFYNDCMNLDDQQIAFQNESFIRVKSIIINCHLQ